MPGSTAACPSLQNIQRRCLSSTSTAHIVLNCGLFICLISSCITSRVGKAYGFGLQPPAARRRTSVCGLIHPPPLLSPSTTTGTAVRLIDSSTEVDSLISIDKGSFTTTLEDDLSESYSTLRDHDGLLDPTSTNTLCSEPFFSEQQEDERLASPSSPRKVVRCELSEDADDECIGNTRKEVAETESAAVGLESSCKADSPEEDEKGHRVDSTAKAAALLARKSRSTLRTSKSKATTSVGQRRVGSASKARTSGSSTITRLVDAIKTGNSRSQPKSGDKPNDSSSSSSPTPPSSSTPSRAMIEATINTMMAIPKMSGDYQKKPHTGTKSTERSMGLFGEAVWSSTVTSPSKSKTTESQLDASTKTVVTKPRPGSLLMKVKMHLRPRNLEKDHPEISPKTPFDENVIVRVAKTMDDVQIASLRLSVFSSFSPETRRAFRDRSCQLLATRRHRGATCVVATIPSNSPAANVIMSTLDADDGPKDHQQHIFFPPTLLPTMWSPQAKKRDVVIGTAEISFHEFEGTKLGMSRSSGSILYVTEVAVNHSYRRQGIAKLLMQAVDKIAALRKVETVYLHVDTENRGAIQLYTDAGYKILPKDNLLFSEFTRKLNLHDGFTKGRNHHLLSKDLLQPTWHDYEVNLVETSLQTSLSSSKRIGFDVFDEHLRQTS